MTHRAAEGPSLTHAALLRLLRLRTEGASLVALAKEVGVTPGTLRKRLKAVAAITGRGFAAQPEIKVPAKAHRSLSVPMKRRGVPSRTGGARAFQARAAGHAGGSGAEYTASLNEKGRPP